MKKELTLSAILICICTLMSCTPETKHSAIVVFYSGDVRIQSAGDGEKKGNPEITGQRRRHGNNGQKLTGHNTDR